MLVITVALLFDSLWFTCDLLLLCGDVKLNQGIQDQIRILQNKNSVCHWSLNSIAAHNLANAVLLKVHNSIHKFDIVCLSEA